jgi:Tol biopolymer transport system component
MPGGCGIWTTDLDGLTPQHVTFHDTDSFPTWWEDQIVFASQQRGNLDIYRVTLDEIGRSRGDPEQLTTDPAHDTTPVFSPDGRHIFFRSARNDEWATWVMNADGSDQRRVIPTGGSDAWNREKISVVVDIP